MKIKLAVVLSLTFAFVFDAQAGSATWKQNPFSDAWYYPHGNWMPRTVPNGPSDTATFDTSNQTAISVSSYQPQIGAIVFNPDASAFTFTLTPSTVLNVVGQGITNNSRSTQNFIAYQDQFSSYGGEIDFAGSSTAGNKTAFTLNGSRVPGTQSGKVYFFDSSNSGQGSYTMEAGLFSGCIGGYLTFKGESSAADGKFVLQGAAVSGASGGAMDFYDSASAGNGKFTVNGSTTAGNGKAFINFFYDSTAANATFIVGGGTVSGASGGLVNVAARANADNATFLVKSGSNGGNGGLVEFDESVTGGTARVVISGNGTMEVGGHDAPGMTIGSIEGDGIISLGARTLTIGANGRNTIFSGLVQDGGFGQGGSLTKIGQCRVVLSDANTYTGGTSIQAGALLINNLTGSGTGSGSVQVNAGRLGGTGSVAGAVTLGTGAGSGAILSPGYANKTNPGTLTMQNTVTFNSDASYNLELNSNTAAADRAVANGVTINTGAQLSMTDLATGTLPAGTTFTAVENTATTGIRGTFANLPDAGTITVGGNTFEANYEGGDGNDLTLTVIGN